LRFLEHIVGNDKMMQEWLHSYFSAYRTQSVTTDQMRAHFLQFFDKKVSEDSLKKIDWDHWLHGAGLPSFDPNTIYDHSLANIADELAKKWLEHSGADAKHEDLQGFQTLQILYFLDKIINGSHTSGMPHDVLKRLNDTYLLSKSPNVEINFRWLMLALTNKLTEVYPQVDAFLGKYGRGLYVRPMYNLLKVIDLAEAKKIYQKHRSFYHSVIRSTFDKDLKN